MCTVSGMANKIKMGTHFCKTPKFFKSGRWKCPQCSTVFQWTESTRQDRHGRPLKDGGYWRQITK